MDTVDCPYCGKPVVIVFDEKTLEEEVAELRAIGPTGWRNSEDPWKELQELRDGDENAG